MGVIEKETGENGGEVIFKEKMAMLDPSRQDLGLGRSGVRDSEHRWYVRLGTQGLGTQAKAPGQKEMKI